MSLSALCIVQSPLLLSEEAASALGGIAKLSGNSSTGTAIAAAAVATAGSSSSKREASRRTTLPRLLPPLPTPRALPARTLPRRCAACRLRRLLLATRGSSARWT